MTKTKNLVGVDFSEEMLGKAKLKIKSNNVQFVQADIKNEWQYDTGFFDLITFSLVLEHIADLDAIFRKAYRVLAKNGLIYIGELHPFKQYLGTKARFETDEGVYELECFTHHFSDFYETATNHNFECLLVKEWFDEEDRGGVPRILTMVFRKK